MTGPRIDEVIHATPRLRICAYLSTVDRAEFSTVRELLEVSDSVTSKHLKVLSDAGYVAITKPVGIGRVRTWLELTPAGMSAYRDHVAALESIVAGMVRSAPAATSRAVGRTSIEPTEGVVPG